MDKGNHFHVRNEEQDIESANGRGISMWSVDVLVLYVEISAWLECN